MILNSLQSGNLNKINRATRGNFAFTLIELLVVIAIIGILSALIVVGMSSTTQKANIAKSQVFANSLRNSLLNNVVAQYNFNDISDAKIGTIAVAADIKDSWGNNNCIAAETTGPTIRGGIDCVTGKCLQFNGPTPNGAAQVGDYLYFPQANYPEGDVPITLEVWVKPAEFPSNTVVLLGKRWGDGTGLKMYSSSFIMATYSSTGSHPYYYSKSFVLNKWYYVVGSYKNSVVKICVNTDCESYAAVPPRAQTIYQIIMGAADYNYNHLGGFIDEARFYNEEIPTSQIQQNYFVGLNKLLAKGNIGDSDYKDRVFTTSSNYGKR